MIEVWSNPRSSELCRRLRRVRLAVFDFDGVFTDNTVYLSEDGTESVRFWRSDGLGLDRLRRLGVDLLVLSTESNSVVSARCRKLGLDVRQGCADKFATLQELWVGGRGDAESTAFLGNDVNDIHCLRAVAVPAVVADAHPDVRAYAAYVTARRGGLGAVREWCDVIAEALEERDGS